MPATFAKLILSPTLGRAANMALWLVLAGTTATLALSFAGRPGLAPWVVAAGALPFGGFGFRWREGAVDEMSISFGECCGVDMHFRLSELWDEKYAQ